MINNKKIVALCTSRVYDPQIHSFIEILNDALKEEDVFFFIFAINADLYWDEESRSSETAVFDLIPWDVTDAVIIMDEKIKSRRISGHIIEEAHAHELPVIVVDGKYDDTVTISFDYAKGFEEIVRHVIEDHKVKDPHFMAGFKDNVFSEERLAIFKRVLDENGIPYSPDRVSYGEFWARPAREAANEILKRKKLPDAVICANDIMAINVCDVFINAGLRIPEDMIVTGFDGYDETFLLTPAITTSSCKTTELSDAAIEAVRNALAGIPQKNYEVLPKMYPNESCGCPRCTESGMAMKRFNTGFYRYQDDIRQQHSIVARMQTSASAEELVHTMWDYYMPYAHCIVEKECFRSDRDYFKRKYKGKDLCVLYDFNNQVFGTVPFEPSDIMPGLSEHMRSGYPIIFYTLDYMNKPMGYICHTIPGYDMTEYSKTIGITDMISGGLGGYINMRYQQFLIQKVEEMYKYDALTGLYNRLAFQEAFEEIKKRPENDGIPLVVIMADLDRLKNINDTLGHDAGDRAIASVANALKNACPEDALCVRFGGDEMLSFIPGGCDCEGILKKIEEDLEKDSVSLGYQVACSCGTITTIMKPDLKVDNVVRMVDKEMYLVKSEHRKRT